MRSIDLAGSSHTQLVEELRGADIVVSTISELHLQKTLAKAAKDAGVTRFIPSDFSPTGERGSLRLHDMVSVFFSLRYYGMNPLIC